MPVSTAAAITGSPCRVKGPAQAITTAASPISSRSPAASSSGTAATAGSPPTSPATASSLSLLLPASVTCAPRWVSSRAISRPV